MKKLDKLAIMVLAFATPQICAAQDDTSEKSETRVYLNAGFEVLGLESFDDDRFDFLFPDSTTNYLGRVGLELGSYVAVEGDIAFGGSDDSADVDYKSRYAGFVRTRWPVLDRFELFGRVGYATTKLDVIDYSGLAYGGGVEFFLDRNRTHGLRLEYTRYEFGRDEFDDKLSSRGTSLAYAYRF